MREALQMWWKTGQFASFIHSTSLICVCTDNRPNYSVNIFIAANICTAHWCRVAASGIPAAHLKNQLLCLKSDLCWMIHFIQMYLRTRPISGEKAHRIVPAPGAVTLSNMFTTPSPQSSTFIDEEIKMHQECQCRPSCQASYGKSVVSSRPAWIWDLVSKSVEPLPRIPQ